MLAPTEQTLALAEPPLMIHFQASIVPLFILILMSSHYYRHTKGGQEGKDRLVLIRHPVSQKFPLLPLLEWLVLVAVGCSSDVISRRQWSFFLSAHTSNPAPTSHQLYTSSSPGEGSGWWWPLWARHRPWHRWKEITRILRPERKLPGAEV